MVFHKNQKTALQQGVKFKKSMLAMCIMALSAPSFAQDAPTTNEVTEEVVVTGVRASLQNAQDIKRESSTVVDAISASDIGSLPDKSVLESLQRVPGVSIERFAGRNDPDHFSIEGSGVTLRGLPQTRSEFNGRDSFSANSGRGLSFQDVPPELMSKVEVFKSQSAKMIEGGISGTINLNTRKPFDSSDRQLAFSVAGNYADLSEETKPSISGLYSDRWETDAGEFGFLVSLATSELTSRTDGVAYGQIGDNTTGSTANDGELQADERFKSTTVVVDGQTVQRFAPINARIASAIQERERNGGSLVGQWRNPDDTLLATVEYVYSDSGRNWLEHNVESDDKIGTYSNLSANGLYVTAGEVNNVDSYTTTTRFSDSTSKVEDFSFRLEFTPSDELKLTGDVQYVKASTDAIDLSIQTGVRANTEFDFTSDRPKVLMTSPDAGVSSEDFFVDPANYFWRSAMDHLEDSEGEELAIKLDAEYQIGDGWLRSVETGIRFSDREQDVKWSQYNWGNLSENWAGNGRKYFSGLQDNTPWDGDSKNGVPYDHNIAFDQFSYEGGHFRKGGKSGVAGGNFLAASEELVTNYDNFVAATRPFGYQPAGYRATAYDGGLYTLAELTNTTEQNQAAYVQLNFSDSEDRLTGNIGVRLVKVETESTGGNAYPEVWDDNLAEAIAECTSCDAEQLAEDEAFSNGALEIGTETGSFTEVLPSFNVRYMLTDDVQTRFAVSKAISFADIGNLRNFTSISATPTLTRPGGDESAPPTDVTFEYSGSGGNPHLKPMESINYDAAVEWYFADAGSVFGGLFYKDMSNFFANEAVQTTVVNNGITRTVLMDLPVNKSVDASIAGFEAGYQQFYDMLPAPFDGLGLQLNLTLLDVSGTSPNSNIDPANPPGSADAGFTPTFTDLPLQGMSETTYNIVGMYEKDDLSIRLAYNWRSDYLLTTRDVITRLPIYAQASGQLDGSIFYTINDNFKIGLEGSNLMDEVTWTKMQVTQEGSVIPRNYFINDRRYSIVLKGQF